MPLVYDELRKLASAKMAAENPGHTLDATALVHEAYVRLTRRRSFASESHFLRAAAQSMRRILVDHARSCNAAKRGRSRRVDFDPGDLAARIPDGRIEELDEALSRLAAEKPELAELVQPHVFGGQTLSDAAGILGLSPRTADTWWTYARAWLAIDLDKSRILFRVTAPFPGRIRLVIGGTIRGGIPMNELDLFAAALAIADPVERSAVLDRACVGQFELRDRLRQLLDAHARSNPLLDRPGLDRTVAGQSATVDSVAAGVADTVIAGKYKLLQQIGEGGMGTVWMADQTEPIKRRVAVKLIRVDRGNSATVLARFAAERQAIALMDHPHIAKLLDAGTTDAGQPYFVMELVKGIPLTEFCDTHKLSVQHRLGLFQQICSAVQHAHNREYDGIRLQDLAYDFTACPT